MNAEPKSNDPYEVLGVTPTTTEAEIRSLIAALTEARTDAGLTQQTLADRLGRPQSFVAKVEGFERRLDAIELLQMTREIGVDPIPMLQDAWESVRNRT